MSTRTSLNGKWDFLPLTDRAAKGHTPPGPVPKAGWSKTPIVVPGSWNDGGCPAKADPDAFWLEWQIFDSCDTPKAWHGALSAWYRRTFDNPVAGTGRAILHIGGALRCAWVFVNGHDPVRCPSLTRSC